MSISRRLVLTAALGASLGLGWVAQAWAAAERPEEYIRRMGTAAFGIIQNEPSREGRIAKLDPLFRDALDLKTIGRFALGTHWNETTPAQRAEYERTFSNVVVKNYSRLWSQENPKGFTVGQSQTVGDRDHLVSTEVQRQDKPALKLGWRVRQTENGYKIIDVMVDGISMLITQRDDFNSAVRQNGVDGLIAMLKQREAQL